MASMKSLAKDTAIYGLSSIIGRFLNYFLVPLYTHVIAVASGGYGIVTNLYAYVALLLVILTFGMETTFFRFANKDGENPHCVFSTTIAVVGTLTIAFMAAILLFIDPIASVMGYLDHKEYILMMACVVSLDAIQAIPFSYLRYKKRPLKFAALKLLFIFLNIGLNLLYFVALPKIYGSSFTVFGMEFATNSVAAVFFLNLVCTGFITFFFIPEFAHEHVAARQYCRDNNIPFKIVDFSLLKRMLSYSWPILVLGIAGILNQTIDKMLFPIVYGDAHPAEDPSVPLGVYGACVKIAMIMAMITQAFRYAYEPIVFAKSKDSDQKEYYAQAMKYFLIFTLFAFLCVMGYMPILRHIIGSYSEGLSVVPIVMVAEIMMGVYFNLSFWYKLIDKTIWGAWFSLAGCTMLIAVNVIFIPEYSYMACAWGGVAGYGTAMVLSYIIGQKRYPINYDLKGIFTYVLITAVFYGIMTYTAELDSLLQMALNTILIVAYLAFVVKKDMPLRSLPVVGRYFR